MSGIKQSCNEWLGSCGCGGGLGWGCDVGLGWGCGGGLGRGCDLGLNKGWLGCGRLYSKNYPVLHVWADLTIRSI